MLHRILAALALSAGLAACSDSLAPIRDTSTPALSTALRSDPCLDASAGTVVTQVAPGTSEPVSIAATEGDVVTRVAVLAGSSCWLSPEGAMGSYTITVDDTPCFEVAGLGTAAVTVTRVGEAPTCKNVTHVQYASAPAPVAGTLTVCKQIITDDGGPFYLYEPFQYTVADAVITIPNLVYDPSLPGDWTPSLPYSCADPISLPAGEYVVAELGRRTGHDYLYFTSPAELLVSADYTARTATVRIVAGVTTTLTFETLWGDPQP